MHFEHANDFGPSMNKIIKAVNTKSYNMIVNKHNSLFTAILQQIVCYWSHLGNEFLQVSDLKSVRVGVVKMLWLRYLQVRSVDIIFLLVRLACQFAQSIQLHTLQLIQFCADIVRDEVQLVRNLPCLNISRLSIEYRTEWERKVSLTVK